MSGREEGAARESALGSAAEGAFGLEDAVRRVVELVVAPLQAEVEALRAAVEEASAGGALPRVLSVEQACEQMGVKRTKLYELLGATDLAETCVAIPGVRRTLFDRELLLAWIERRAGVAGRQQRGLAGGGGRMAPGLRRGRSTTSRRRAT